VSVCRQGKRLLIFNWVRKNISWRFLKKRRTALSKEWLSMSTKNVFTQSVGKCFWKIKRQKNKKEY
jgi:hypothetical protein